MAGSVTGIILLVLGGFLMVRGWPGMLGTIQARRWDAVQGTITASGVQGYSGMPGGGHGRARFARAGVAYTYEVDGMTYTGNRITFGAPLGFGAGLQGAAAKQAARRSPGDPVAVWHDPRDASRSVLHPVDYTSMLLFDVGVALVVIGVLSL